MDEEEEEGKGKGKKGEPSHFFVQVYVPGKYNDIKAVLINKYETYEFCTRVVTSTILLPGAPPQFESRGTSRIFICTPTCDILGKVNVDLYSASSLEAHL